MPRTPEPKLSIRERIKKVAAQSAPSMYPLDPAEDKPTPPPEKEVLVVPQLKDLVPDRKLSLELARKIQRLGEISRMKSELTKEDAPIKNWVKDVAGVFKISDAQSGDWRLKYYASPRATINPDMLMKALLKRGVLPKEIEDIIEESTKTSDGFTLKVSPIGAKELPEGEEGK